MLIWSHNPVSRGARDLARALGARRIKHQGSNFRGGEGTVIINWGANTLPNWRQGTVILNEAENVTLATNKLSFFEHLKAHKLEGIFPPFTTSREEAAKWVTSSKGSSVVCRTLLRASSGRGITIARSKDELVPAPLYVKYRKKKEEFRVHCGKSSRGTLPFDVQRKARSRSVADADVDWRVRTHHTGFIYMRENIRVPEVVVANAIQAFDTTGLDFGAVDVIYNADSGKAFVLEINTAPGLEGTTLESYAQYFRNLM